MKKLENKLPKAFKTKWLKALRSGKYIQGIESLKSTDFNDEGKEIITWCCLGVAADICGCSNIKSQGFINKGTKIKGISNVPTLLIEENPITTKLSQMNDGTTDNRDIVPQCNFNKIADYIEENL